MGNTTVKKRIAILGGGPSGLFMYKRLIESELQNIEIEIFERKNYLGAGMPYSNEGASEEHITNVSDNEIPVIFNTIEEWVKEAPPAVLKKFNINAENFNEYKVLPRLFFGEYLSAQFGLLQQVAEKKGIVTVVHLNTKVTDLHDKAANGTVLVTVDTLGELIFDHVVVCTGHNWPKKHEGRIPGYFDSPYPPRKLAMTLNHPVGIKGASLTAIDALRTMARKNGTFEEADGKICYQLDADCKDFKIVMHSRNGLLPAIRFHLEDSHLGKDALIGRKEIEKNIAENGGFLSLDFVFEKNFKDMFPEKDPEFYYLIKDMDIESFVAAMMEMREKISPFELFRKEYVEAELSIKKRESIYWKEMLAVLSFAMNYPAKYLSAEDMQRLQKVLMPLISIVIAFVPQSSCRELMALHDAGVLDLVSVGDDSRILPVDSGGADYHYTDEDGETVVQHFETFVDCVGQPHLSMEDFPFKGLLEGNTVSPARLRFQSAAIAKEEVDSGNELVEQDDDGAFFLKVPGITINDNFQVVDGKGIANERIYILAVPYIGGYNPDYSGIDFCEAASDKVVKAIKTVEI
ncbi:FAD/NAD(P)-binding protein [Pedobacter psychroterrae]|uniref:FAD-dependent urate hydroxylase HpyO/Asp monooxygenase CreE-like FAD/NAD(P)-binding domain-containing protein n=1 Tax=Pedobacter psychroterrae TaxID=2530453 RepID=A0A4R0NQF7_9SPHI|nr:FAD/NAD(P)-binding protein [Pedobacter psychroterrae]TCD03300.1 hypothetical protein EZ437_04830 [Pedobacter psychroterrae]